MAGKNILTYEGLKKYEDELQNLKINRRQEVAQKLKEARAQGDLSENAEYDAAKDEQSDIESRIVEIEAISKMLKFGKDVGCPIELVHVSTWQAMELAKKAKAEGQPVMVETCPHYLLLDESYVEKYGAYAKCNPALRKKEDVERLWD